jgi:hypothetical protein
MQLNTLNNDFCSSRHRLLRNSILALISIAGPGVVPLTTRLDQGGAKQTDKSVPSACAYE